MKDDNGTADDGRARKVVHKLKKHAKMWRMSPRRLRMALGMRQFVPAVAGHGECYLGGGFCNPARFH